MNGARISHRSCRKSTRLRAALFLSALAVSPAHAQTAPNALDALNEVARCAGVGDPGERLKCYDNAAALAKGALAAAPKAEEKKNWLDWFGFSKPPAPKTTEDFGKPAPPPGPEEVTKVTSNVLEFAKTSRGEAVFILENGQIWRQLQGDNTIFREPLPSPMKATIDTGVLGSYNLTIEGRNAMMKVMRLK